MFPCWFGPLVCVFSKVKCKWKKQWRGHFLTKELKAEMASPFQSASHERTPPCDIFSLTLWYFALHISFLASFSLLLSFVLALILLWNRL